MLRRAALTALFAATAIVAADVTGNWQFQVKSKIGNGTPTVTLKQSGDKLSGKYAGAIGQADVTGTVNGSTVQFQFAIAGINIVYKGELEGQDNIKGSVLMGTEPQGTFTGTRAK